MISSSLTGFLTGSGVLNPSDWEFVAMEDKRPGLLKKLEILVCPLFDAFSSAAFSEVVDDFFLKFLDNRFMLER